MKLTGCHLLSFSPWLSNCLISVARNSMKKTSDIRPLTFPYFAIPSSLLPLSYPNACEPSYDGWGLSDLSPMLTSIRWLPAASCLTRQPVLFNHSESRLPCLVSEKMERRALCIRRSWKWRPMWICAQWGSDSLMVNVISWPHSRESLLPAWSVNGFQDNKSLPNSPFVSGWRWSKLAIIPNDRKLVSLRKSLSVLYSPDS